MYPQYWTPSIGGTYHENQACFYNIILKLLQKIKNMLILVCKIIFIERRW